MLTDYSINVCKFAQTLIEFVKFAFLFVDGLIPGISWRVGIWCGKCFYYFYMIVHVETSFGDIIHIFATFGSISKLPLSNLFDRIEILFERLILCLIPGYVSMSIIGIHSMWGHDIFWVIHDKIITKSKLYKSE